jgi:hypothetical protein
VYCVYCGAGRTRSDHADTCRVAYLQESSVLGHIGHSPDFKGEPPGKVISLTSTPKTPKTHERPKRKRPIQETFDLAAIKAALIGYYGLPEDVTLAVVIGPGPCYDPRVDPSDEFKHLTADYTLEA